jgi:hypothetical protein
MARVQLKPARSARRVIREIALSDEIASSLRPIAQAVLSAAQSDPNARYVSRLSIRQHRSRGPLGRVSWRVGCEIPELGLRVEAERGTLARALGAAGA